MVQAPVYPRKCVFGAIFDFQGVRKSADTGRCQALWIGEARILPAPEAKHASPPSAGPRENQNPVQNRSFFGIIFWHRFWYAFFRLFFEFGIDFGSHFGFIFASFSILFACLFLALILRCSWIDFSCNFRCPERRKPCSRCSGSVISYFSPFSKKHEKSMISASILAPFLHHFPYFLHASF